MTSNVSSALRPGYLRYHSDIFNLPLSVCYTHTYAYTQHLTFISTDTQAWSLKHFSSLDLQCNYQYFMQLTPQTFYHNSD